MPRSDGRASAQARTTGFGRGAAPFAAPFALLGALKPRSSSSLSLSGSPTVSGGKRSDAPLTAAGSAPRAHHVDQYADTIHKSDPAMAR